jgi:type IV pilus assembly protein PilN
LINVNLLPKNLRRVREPGYWRLLAIVFPLLVVGIAFVAQLFAYQTQQNLLTEKQSRSDQLALLQPYLKEQQSLLARQQALNQLISVEKAVHQNRILWTGEISGLLETLPPRGAGARPNIDFKSLSMSAINPPHSNPNEYEGKSVIAQMNVSGDVVGPEVLAQFIHALETSKSYGVAFHSASRQGQKDLFSYSLTVGALAGSKP